jgi:hypothetical protein
MGTWSNIDSDIKFSAIIIKTNVFLLQTLVTFANFGFSSFGIPATKTFNLFGFPIFWLWVLPDEGYSRNVSCSLD